MHVSTDIWIWLAAVLTLCIYSFLYKDNPFYKFAEHLLVGVSAGYFFVIYFWNLIVPNLLTPLKTGFETLFTGGGFTGGLAALIPGILGLLILTRLIPKVGWMSRWAIAFYIGAFQGIFITGYMQAFILAQVYGTFIKANNPVFSLTLFGDFAGHPGWGPFILAVSGPLMIVGVICTLTYFFFSTEHKGFVGGVARAGIVFLMIGFGASFGYTVMARVSLLIGRLQFLLRDWLGLIS
jgi:hypothetical protein